MTEENVNYLGHKSEPPAGGTGNDTIEDPKVWFKFQISFKVVDLNCTEDIFLKQKAAEF